MVSDDFQLNWLNSHLAKIWPYVDQVSSYRADECLLISLAYVVGYNKQNSLLLFFYIIGGVMFDGVQAASELIRASVEPILEQYRPLVLSSLKFSKLTLGTIAPQFTGEI